MNENVLSIFSRGDVDGISTLISQMEKSPFDYLRIEGDGVKIVIGKNGVTECEAVHAPVAAPTAPASAPAPAPAPTATVAAAPVAQAAAATAVQPAASAVASVEEQPGVFIIKAPSYGMYYSQSEPGAPPYVSVGKTVKIGDTVGLLEIMKTFNAITSEVDGEVIGIHVENEALLEPGQALVSIRMV